MINLKRIYEKAAMCRAFEEECVRRIDSKEIKFPVYLSAGQEYGPATVSTWLEDQGITSHDMGGSVHKPIERDIFIQHRGHSTYLCFGGDMKALVRELRGDPKGCSNGMGGSASIQSKEAHIYGHDGMLGSQIPIAVGACYATRRPTICFAGDAAVEEDYAYPAFGWAVTHKLPILFVIEDNNMSVLTEKKVRRSWKIAEVAEGFGLCAEEVADIPSSIYQTIPRLKDQWPALINIHSTRLRWHAGAGMDDPHAFDRHEDVGMCFDTNYRKQVFGVYRELVKQAWEEA